MLVKKVRISKFAPIWGKLNIYICDYFGITPKEFFDMDVPNPTKAQALWAAAQGLSDEQLDNLIAIAKGLSR